MRAPWRGPGPVVGPTDNVVIVGAGLAGLTAALRLAGAGRSVTVVEREDVPGGRVGLLERGGYRFDTGPSVLTMPHPIADALACVGERLDDWLTLDPVSPIFRAHYPDGSVLDVHADVDDMADEIAVVIGPDEATGYRRYMDFLTTLHRLTMRSFIDRNVDSPLELLTPDLARLAAIGGFRRLGPTVGQYLKDPRTQRAFSFPSMFAGMGPQNSLAIDAVVAGMDSGSGVHVPRGGMHAVPTALAGAAVKHGVTLRYGTTVTMVEHDGLRASAVITSEGERIPADVVVLNPDLPVAHRDLLGLEPWTIRRLRYPPSCVLLLVGSTATYSRIAHHNIHFGRRWAGTFDELVEGGDLMTDPTLMVSSPTDPGLAPPDRQSYSVIFPTPNLDAPIDWSEIGPRYRDHMVEVLEARGYLGFGDAIEVEDLTTPLDWAARGMERGSPFGAAHAWRRTGLLRPGNRWGENVVFTGAGTQPGVGIAPVLISGRIAAERIVGPLPRPAA